MIFNVTLDRWHNIRFNISGLPQSNRSDDRGDPNDPHVRLKRDCVGLMAAFKLNDPSHHLVIVANTHIYWYGAELSFFVHILMSC